MPKVTQAHRESRRDQVLDAALLCFAERGFQATSMADIVAASGVSSGAIYLYFAGKQEIATAVARRAIGGRLGELAELQHAERVPPPGVVIRRIGESLDREGVPAGLIVQMWGEAATDPAFQAIASGAFAVLGERFAAYLARWAEQEQGSSAAEARAFAEQVRPAMLAFAQGYFIQRTLIPDFDRDAYLAAVTRVLG